MLFLKCSSDEISLPLPEGKCLRPRAGITSSFRVWPWLSPDLLPHCPKQFSLFSFLLFSLLPGSSPFLWFLPAILSASRFLCPHHVPPSQCPENEVTRCASSSSLSFCCWDKHHGQRNMEGAGYSAYTSRSQFITEGSWGKNWSRIHRRLD